MRSDDRAATWSVLPVPDTGLFAIPYLSAVAPADPSTVYVRVHGQGQDRLLVSSNGGRGWQRVLEGRAVMAGFALSPDGTELAIGFGLPPRPRNVDCDQLGIWKAPTGDCRSPYCSFLAHAYAERGNASIGRRQKRLT